MNVSYKKKTALGIPASQMGVPIPDGCAVGSLPLMCLTSSPRLSFWLLLPHGHFGHLECAPVDGNDSLSLSVSLKFLKMLKENESYENTMRSFINLLQQGKLLF